MKKKKLLLIVSILVVIALVGTGFYLVENRIAAKSGPLELYGNVDIREVNLAFQIPERVKETLSRKAILSGKATNSASLETVRIQNSIRQSGSGGQSAGSGTAQTQKRPAQGTDRQARAILEAERAVERFAEIQVPAAEQTV